MPIVPPAAVKVCSLRGKLSAGVISTALKLPSTNVQWEIKEDKIIFTAQGYGHGVGLCQYGAAGPAAAGSSYPEIIDHYYTDVKVTSLPAP